MASSPDLAGRLRALPAAVPLLDAFDGDVSVWIVGGAVRDLLLGGEPVDLDLVVEGDAVAAARTLCAALAGTLVAHERFGTASVTGGGHVYDLATARAETYARPGALPDVRPATPEEDLLRRDFTVNAIAVALDGRVAAAPHAFKDLDARVLRVLHSRSFRDDPTRLLRLARYATRLGFAVEPETERLAAEALADGALATVTPPRVGSELRLLLCEPSASDALAWVSRWPLVTGMAFDPALAERAAGLLPHDGRRDLLLLAVACRRMPAPDLAAWLDALGVPARERDVVVTAAVRARRIAQELAAARRRSQIARAAQGVPLEAVALAGALGPQDAARAWIEELRDVRLAIDGADLLAAGLPQGEAIGRGLAAALDARLDGEAADRDAQLAVALAAAAA